MPADTTSITGIFRSRSYNPRRHSLDGRIAETQSEIKFSEPFVDSTAMGYTARSKKKWTTESLQWLGCPLASNPLSVTLYLTKCSRGNGKMYHCESVLNLVQNKSREPAVPLSSKIMYNRISPSEPSSYPLISSREMTVLGLCKWIWTSRRTANRLKPKLSFF